MNPLFTVCLIARNENKTLPRLVKSLEEYQLRGGDIYLLDTDSTDNTPEVARDLGCIVEEVGNKYQITIDKEHAKSINSKFVVKGEEKIVKSGDTLFDFTSARNYVASLSKTDMVAMPDCDEVYTKLDIDAINKQIEQGVDQLEYNFVYSHDENGNPGIQFTHSKFYNKEKMKRKGIIHEVLHPDKEIYRKYLNEDVIKLEHFQNVETNRDKYLIGLAYDCYMDLSNDRNSHYLARELMYKGRYKSAIQEFVRHIAMDKRHTEKSQSMIYIGDCLRYLGRSNEALGWYTRALDIEPNRREPLIALAKYYRDVDNFNLAKVYALGALEIGQTSYYSNVAENYRELPHEILYRAYRWLGDKDKSREHYDMAVWYNPVKQKYIDDKQFYT